MGRDPFVELLRIGRFPFTIMARRRSEALESVPLLFKAVACLSIRPGMVVT
ncbi:hypothetical protein M407DRAFT_104419 [Tulasnella calospora MUT 4182]|uniref:Uncharacterized protein n=1 Tax=Tulasnella calospora MUT 4182 TaxID=1051891 RepID=A0A0C3PZI6_9AGAM|nr:hypothetical protein M407DRAFT_104419 [Tulasnella calospora MUT 4182]